MPVSILQVVYAIMHRQEVFQPFRNHPRFNELLENIFTVCALAIKIVLARIFGWINLSL